jgi:phosphatidylglycerophosphate synthase
MAPDPDDRVRFERAAKWLAVVMVGALVGSIVWGRSEPLAAAGTVGLVLFAIALWRIEAPRSSVPTLVTALRIAITAGTGFCSARLTNGQVMGAVVVVFGLDWLDGFLARRLDVVSRLGARLDNEGDAFLVAVVCVLLWQRTPLGAWILVAGFLRYVYVLTVHFFPSRGEAPRSKLASRSFGIALVGFMVGLLELPVVSRVLPLLSTMLLTWSFSRSFYWSLRKA